MSELKSFFEEYGNFVCIQDLGIVCHGTLITHIIRVTDKHIQLWAGNPDEDKYAEQLILSKDELEAIIKQILNLM